MSYQNYCNSQSPIHSVHFKSQVVILLGKVAFLLKAPLYLTRRQKVQKCWRKQSKVDISCQSMSIATKQKFSRLHFFFPSYNRQLPLSITTLFELHSRIVAIDGAFVANIYVFLCFFVPVYCLTQLESPVMSEKRQNKQS